MKKAIQFILIFISILVADREALAQNIRVNNDNNGKETVKDKALQHYINAKENIRKDSTIKALIELNEATKLLPNFTEAYVLKGEIWENEKEFRKAIGQYSLALLHNPSLELVYLKRASLYFKLKDHRDYILNDVNSAIELKPNSAQLYVLKSYYYAHTLNPNSLKYDFPNAIITITKAITIDPNNATNYKIRSDYKLKNEQKLSSLLDINKAIMISETNDTFYHQRSIIRFTMGDFRSSLDDINQAIQLNSHSILYFQLRGNIYYNLKKYERSYQDYSITINLIFEQITKSDIKIMPNSKSNLQLRQTLLLRGMASVQGNKPYDGCDDFNRALQMGENKAQNYLSRYCN